VPLTLYVDTAAWREHLRAEVARDPGLVPVAKGNGYGFTVPLLARTAADLGVGRIAVGTAEDATVALRMFPGDVIVLQPPAEADPLPSDAGRRVLYTAGSVRAAAVLACQRLIVDCRSSLLRQGITESDLAALWRVTDGGRAIEAFSLHLPIDRPPGTDPAAETARWVSVLMAAGYEVRTMYVSHLDAAELATLSAAFPDTDFRQRVGTRLWLGRSSAFRAAATVLQVLPVRRGERLGYRQYRSARDGWLVVVAGGTAHGVGLEAPGVPRGLLPQTKALARSGLAAINRVRSPFTWDGRRQWFAEPPHMLVSMLSLPRDTEPPKPGMELGAELRYTATLFDRITLSLGGLGGAASWLP
jgi:alanine racemase-like protein